MKFSKCKKLLAVTSMVALVGSVTAFADTYINENFVDGYGKYMLDVNSSSGMRSCDACAWGSKEYNYKVKLITVYSDGQEVVRDTGFIAGSARITSSYEWAEDYQAFMAVRDGIEIRDKVWVSGS